MIMREGLRPITKEQQKDIDKNPPMVRERVQSESRSMLVQSAGLTQGDIDVLGKIGDIKKTLDENGKPKYTYSFQGQEFESGYQYNFDGDKNGVPYLRMDGVTVGETDSREVRETHRKLGIYEVILRQQQVSAEEAQAFINEERPDLREEQAWEPKMIADRIREEKEEVGRKFLDMMSKL